MQSLQTMAIQTWRLLRRLQQQLQQQSQNHFKNLFKAIWCLLVAFLPVLGFNNVSYQVDITPSNSQTPRIISKIPRIIFVSVAISGPLLLYVFWDIIYGAYLVFRAFIYTSSIVLWTVSRVGTCISSPSVCLWSAYMALSQSQRTLNNNNQRLLIPNLVLEMPHKIWSDELIPGMQRMIEVTDTKTSSVDGNKIVAPPLTDIITSLTRISSAIEIISDRNSVSMRDQALAYLVPKLQALQLRTFDLQKLYESYRIRWAKTLTELAMKCRNVADRVSRLEQEWELILDEVARIDNEGKGDGVPRPGSVLRRDCNDEHKPSRFAFGKAKERSKHCTFEELASMIYHQILAEHHDHAILQKSVATSSWKGSEEIITLLKNIKKKVSVMNSVAKAAKEEKTGVRDDRSERWVSERKEIWNYLGWGTWGALYSKEEKEARRKEAAMYVSIFPLSYASSFLCLFGVIQLKDVLYDEAIPECYFCIIFERYVPIVSLYRSRTFEPLTSLLYPLLSTLSFLSSSLLLFTFYFLIDVFFFFGGFFNKKKFC
ncbi:e49ad11d-39f0-4bc2-96b7-e2110d19a956-CDS [Sclerotinia trifoliorum]|uniref:E49ad11d-39f0-4bc2-96b7-e2110d19a956-CDS n=1 Tax=Sclerotinia trifoliorum TaxID=28548 RepID=A0A8H2ZVQ0_9HELO|nr:e49ad11d-39f0-4bc2-96b7-e2110d19a956-CDS [Sclerotinia trifoliorum]